MDNQLKIEYHENPQLSDLEILTNGISTEAQKKRNQSKVKFYSFFLKDSSSKIVGGISGCFLWGCLVIDQLWLDESFRKKSYGTKLMQLAEQLGLENNCRFVSVNTMDWEAKDFYIKLGYKVEFERSGYDNNSTFYFMKKSLL